MINTSIKNIDKSFLKWLIDFAKNVNWKITLEIEGKVWSIDEFLPRKEHLKRAQEVKNHLEPIKRYFENIKKKR